MLLTRNKIHIHVHTHAHRHTHKSLHWWTQHWKGARSWLWLRKIYMKGNWGLSIKYFTKKDSLGGKKKTTHPTKFICNEMIIIKYFLKYNLINNLIIPTFCVCTYTYIVCLYNLNSNFFPENCALFFQTEHNYFTLEPIFLNGWLYLQTPVSVSKHTICHYIHKRKLCMKINK